MPRRDTILTINTVEPGLVRAVHMHSKRMGKELKGLVLVNASYADAPDRPRDTTGLFQEIICNCDDPDEIQTVLKPYINRLLAVTYRYENAIEPLRQVVPFLPYVHRPSKSSLLWCSDKRLMRDRLSNYDPDLTPKYQYLEEHDVPQLKQLVQDFSFPVIVKPCGLVESLLVERCDSEQELESRLQHTFQIIHEVYQREYRLNEPAVLVEEMMQGDMYSVDAYVTHEGEIFCLPLVKVITSAAMGLPGFYTYRTSIPTNLPDEEIKAAFATCSAAIKALNLSSSSAHIEMFRTPDGWKVIELGARIGGHRDVLYREAYGIEHFYNDLAVRMGMKPVIPTTPLAHAAGMTLYASEEGTIESIEGIEQASQIGSVVQLSTRAQAGDQALFATNGGHPIVDVIMSHTDPEQLERDVAHVRELIKINLAKPLAATEKIPVQMSST